MKLRGKSALVVSVLLGVVIFSLSYNILITQKKFFVQLISESRIKTLKSFVSMSKEAIKIKNFSQVKNAVELLVLTYKPSVVYAGYISEDGVVVYASKYGDVNIDSEYKNRIKKANSDSIEYYISYNGEQIHEFVTPFFIDGNNMGTFIVGFSQNEMKKQIDEAFSSIISNIKKIAIVILILSILLSYLFGYYTFVKPIRILIKASKQITKGDFNVEIKANRRDEIGYLSKTFNDMAKQIKELDSMKDSFVSSVSHELRSPLSAIDGYCDLLIDCINNNYSKEQQLKGLQIIKNATIRLTSFINNVLDLAKIKANKLELKKVDADIVSLVNEVITLYKPLVIQQKKNIYSEISFDIPKVNIDVEKIKQVIMNLVSNAIKFTKENCNIVIKIFPNSKGYGRKYIEVWVQDDGVGIPKHSVDLIFQKFYQVKEEVLKSPRGTGLGLAIVFEIIKIHKGYVWVSNNENKGATFKIALPK